MKKLSLVLLLVLGGISMMLAQRTITGTVTDDAGEPLIGASIVAKGTGIGDITDIDGTYSVDVPENVKTLVFTYTGYRTQELELGASNVVDVTLSEGVALDEIVITAVGLEANRANLGYSVQNVDAEDLVEARTTNVVNALNSKVAGVQVTSSSGSPGSSSSIRIRGATSINGTNSPLFVIDGVPISNQEFGNGTDGVDQSNRAVDINPNDIESMSVLKGPAATALYGVRAANGAIIITTKSGAQGKPRISFNANYSADRVTQLPERQFEFAQGRPGDSDGDGVLERVYRGPETAEGFSWGPRISDLEYQSDADYPYDPNGRIVPAGQGDNGPVNAYDPYDLFQTGQTADLNVGISGGTDRLRYYMSAGYLDSEGVVPNATFERKTIKATVTADLTDRLTAGVSATYINSGGNRIQRGSNLNGIMLGTVRTTPTFDNSAGFGEDAVDNVDSYIVAADGSQRSYRAGVYDNPYFTINKNPFNDKVNRIVGYSSLAYKATDWLTFSYKLGIDQYSDNRLGAFDINKSPFGFNWNDGSVYTADYNSNDLNSDFLINIATDLSDDLTMNAVIGHNYYRSQLEQSFVTGTTLSVPNFYNLANTQDIISTDSPFSKEIVGALATVDFGYQNALFLNLTARNDWSSILPEEDNDFLSYSASLGWAFTEQFGMQNDDILPYGKLRVSYGQVGNDGGNTAFVYATGDYFGQAGATGDGFISGISFPAYGVNAFERSTVLGNPNLRPETTSTFEIGGEFKFLRGRLGLDITYYDSRSEDLLISTPLSAASGFSNAIQNAATIENKGIELILEGTPVRSNAFTWDIMANFTQYENDVIELAPGVEEVFLAGFTSTSARLIPGNPFSALFGSGFQRNDNGDVVIGADGWPLVDPVPGFLGDPNPDFQLGLRNTFTIGQNVSISALLDIREGGDMWCGTCGVANYFGVTKETADLRDETVVFEGVMEDGTRNTTAVPYADVQGGVGASYWVRYGFGGIGEMNIHDTSWVRLREARVAYTFPKATTDKIGFSDLTIALTGRNLFLITDYPGIDPETNLTGTSAGYGLDYFNMPNTRSFNFGVSANF